MLDTEAGTARSNETAQTQLKTIASGNSGPREMAVHAISSFQRVQFGKCAKTRQREPQIMSSGQRETQRAFKYMVTAEKGSQSTPQLPTERKTVQDIEPDGTGGVKHQSRWKKCRIT